MSKLEVSVSGFDELADDFERLIRRYPDKAQECIEKNGKQFRKDAIKKLKGMAKMKMHKGKSLRKASGYYVSPIQGYGGNLHVDIGARAPHFHLVERGHQLVGHKPGKVNKGYVEGLHYMEDIIEEYGDKFPQEIDKLATELLEMEGLI